MIQDYLDQLIVVGDRLIIELSESSDRTDSGLYLPPNVKEKEELAEEGIDLMSIPWADKDN